MGILGAPYGELTRCHFGVDPVTGRRLTPEERRRSCARVYFGYYIWPRLQTLMENLFVEPPIFQPPQPQPDPTPFLHELAAVALAPRFDPTPEPMLPDVRLEVMEKFRDGLADLVGELDAEIGKVQHTP